jgi:predicted metalloendopeptidase
LGLIVGEIIFHDFKKDKVEALISFLRGLYQDIIRKATWLDEETREKALQKLHAVNTNNVAFPYFVHNHEELSLLYKDFDVGTDYLEKAINMKAWQMQKSLEQNGPMHNKEDWTTTPITVDAYSNAH